MTMSILEAAHQKAAAGERLSIEEGMALYEENDLLSLAEWARAAKERKSGRKVFYTANYHINLTNICRSNCPLCAFQCEEGDARGFLLGTEEIGKELASARRVRNLSEIHIVSALHPSQPFSYYAGIVQRIRREFPNVEINAFTPVEIVHFSKISGKSVTEVLEILKDAGLSSLPGGGAEILEDRVREIICPKKASAEEWLDAMRQAHKLGIHANASMMYGHVETVEERFRHLAKLRELQDETGGFRAFLLFPFHPENTKLGQEQEIRKAGSWENLKMLALSRLMLDNFDHFKAFWVMLTLPVAQLALGFGADDLDGTIGEEKIIHAAGARTSTGITREKLDAIIRETGYDPVERDADYRAISTGGTA